MSGPCRVDWFEAITENYIDSGGRPLHVLERVRHDFPVALHGVALSIGSADPLNVLDEAEADALGSPLEGQPLGSVVATLTTRGGDPATVSACFARWMALRMIAGCLIR